MPLTTKDIDGLLHLVGLTRDEEIDCGQCLSRVAEFAEHTLASKSIPEGLEALAHHLSVCSECREEYEALLKALENLQN